MKSSENSSRYTRFEFKGPVVKGYDSFNHISTFGLDVRWRKKTAKLVSHLLKNKPNAQVLDLACGTGDMAIAVKQAATDSFVVGTEPSLEMVQAGMPKLRNSEFHPVLGVTHLPFASKTFDAITIAFGVRNFVNLEQDMQECYRLLKPGGKMYVLEFFQPESQFVTQFLSIYQRIFFPIFGFLLTGHISQYRYLYKSIIRFKKRTEFASILDKAGFYSQHAHPFFAGMVHTIVAEK